MSGRVGVAVSYPNAHGNRHAHANSNGDGDADADADSNPYPYSHSYRVGYPNPHTNAHANADADTDTNNIGDPYRLAISNVSIRCAVVCLRCNHRTLEAGRQSGGRVGDVRSRFDGARQRRRSRRRR